MQHIVKHMMNTRVMGCCALPPAAEKGLEKELQDIADENALAVRVQQNKSYLLLHDETAEPVHQECAISQIARSISLLCPAASSRKGAMSDRARRRVPHRRLALPTLGGVVEPRACKTYQGSVMARGGLVMAS